MAGTKNTRPLKVGQRTLSGFEKMGVDELDEGKLIIMAAQALEIPSDSGWWDEQIHDTHGIMFGTPDPKLTDEYLIDESNLRSIFRDLSATWPKQVEMSSFGHWTYSRFICLKIQVLYSNGEITPAFAAACSIALALQDDYPVYDESDWSELEHEKWDEYLDMVRRDLLNDRERDRPFDEPEPLSQDDLDLWADDVIEYLYQNFGPGYRSEIWVSDDDLAAAKAWADSLIGTIRSGPHEVPLW